MSAVPGQFTLPLLAFQHHVGQLYIDPATIQFVRELRQSDLAIVEQGRWQRADGKPVNIVCKVWRPFVVATPQDFRELLLEASKLHRLQHPHLTRFLGLGCFAHGSLAEVRESMFMVEEYVGTRTLRKLISEQMRCRHRNLYDARAAVRWATHVATALSALHEQQPAYVHNDVKADNVFLTDTSRLGAAEAKLGDLKPHRHVYDREPSTLSRHQQQQRTSSPKAPHPSTLMQPKYTLERSSSGCSSNDERRLSWSSAASSTAAAAAGQQHGPGLPLALASAACHTPHHQQQQGSSLSADAEGNSWSSACSTVTVSPTAAAAGAGGPSAAGPAAARVSSLPVPIATNGGHASRGSSCPTDWTPGLMSLHSGSADVYAAAAAAGSPSYFSACSHRSYSSLSSGSLNSSSSMGLQDASSCPSSAPPDPHSLCAEIAAADAAADAAAAAAAAAAAGAGASAEDAAAAVPGDVGGFSWRAVARQRSGTAVYLSDSASSTGARGPNQGKGVVASLADADAEDSSHSAAADVASSGCLDLTHNQLPQQQVVPVQDSKAERTSKGSSRSKGILSSVFSSNKPLQQSPCDFSTEADQVASPRQQQQQQQQQAASISLFQRSKSSPLDGGACRSPHMQLAHSAPDVLQGEMCCEEAVHHGSFLMPLQFSEPTGLCSLQGVAGSASGSGSNTADTTAAALKVRTSRAASGEQQQRLQRSKSAGQAKLPQQQEGGSCVYYGWELLPSGAASPCGAVHSSMLDLFADVAGEDVVTSRRYRDSCHYTLVPGSFVQQRSPLSISALGPVGSGAGPVVRSKSCSTADAAATLPTVSCAAASSAGGSASGRWASSSATSLLSMQQPQQSPAEQPDLAPTVGKGYAPSAIESKQHGSNSAFAALTAIDCIAEEGSSIATDSCAPSRESSAHGGPHFYDSSPFSSSAQGSPQQQPLTPHSSLVNAGSLTKALGLSSLLKQRSGSGSHSLRISSGLAEEDEGDLDSHSRSQHDGLESPQSSSSPHKQQLLHLLVSASSGSHGSHDSLQESGVPSALDEPQLAHKPVADSIEESSGSTSADAVLPPAAAAAAPIKKVRFSLARPAGSTASRDFSLLYAAPELIRGERPTEKVDVFAFGVLLYELLARRLIASNVAEVCSRNSSKRGSRHSNKQQQHHTPTHRHAAEADGLDDDEAADRLDPMPEQQLLLTYAQLVAGGYRPPMLPHFPQPVVQLISSCWAPEPYERPRMSEVLAELRAWQKDRQLLSSLNSFVLALADMGYPGARQQPGCACGCVIS